MLRTFFIAICLVFTGMAAYAQTKPAPKPSPSSDPAAAAIFAQIAASYIDGNVPDTKNFEKFLRRDLTAYFTQATGKKATVEFTPLRNGATQSGVALPKYYFWVRVFHNKKLLQTGAVRVAAREKKAFDVTTFLSKAVMKHDHAQIYQVFPRPVGDKIVKAFLPGG